MTSCYMGMLELAFWHSDWITQILGARNKSMMLTRPSPVNEGVWLHQTRDVTT